MIRAVVRIGQLGLAALPIVGFAALLIGISIGNAQAPSNEVGVFTCTNPASGAQWQIRIDYGRRVVDSHPARIGDAEIKWHDARENTDYTLERKSGNLTVVVPSSTGGYFIHDHCKIAK
jgi:hypothetical protein